MKKFNEFKTMVDALGDDATERQGQRLIEWVVENLPRDRWGDAACYAIEIPNFYYYMRERMAECGVY